MRSMFRNAFVVLMAVLALGAVAASAAQATEAQGPFWRVPCHKVSAANAGLGAFNEEGCNTAGGSKEWDTRLLGGESKAVSVKASKGIVLKEGGSATITCGKLSAAGATVVGSTGSNPGVRKDTITLEECTITGDGSPCEVSGGKIKFVGTKYQFGYEKYGTEIKERRGKILVYFTPSEGAAFTKITLKGSGCRTTEWEVLGSVAGEVWSGGKPVEVGHEPPPATVGEVNFPKTRITTIWVEKEGVVSEQKPLMEGLGGISTLQGTEEVELATKEPFGVFTK